MSLLKYQRCIHAFITTRLDCCNSLFYGLPNTTLNKLQYIQNSSARVLLALLTLLSSYTDFIGFSSSPSNTKSPPPIYFWSHSYLLSSSHTTLFRYWSAIDSSAQVSIVWWMSDLYLCPTLWNSIPKHIRDLPSLQDFKTHPKTYIFLSCFSDLWLHDLIHATDFMFICI